MTDISVIISHLQNIRPATCCCGDLRFQEQIPVDIMLNVVVLAAEMNLYGFCACFPGQLADFLFCDVPGCRNSLLQGWKMNGLTVAVNDEIAVQWLRYRDMSTLNHAPHHSAEGVGYISVFR